MNTGERVRGFITKYALTKGIIEADVTTGERDGVAVWHPSGCLSNYLTEGKEWHRTRAQAVVRARVMRDKKKISLMFQIARLDAMKFE